MINIPKGTKDVLPSDSYKWQYLESIARNTAALYNAREIRTPVFEHTELFLRSIGDSTDVVSKEMYTFEDKGGRSITLKPEGTAPVARSYTESLAQELMPLKMYYLTPVYRYENPQKGRLREHHQFGVEFYGSASHFMDAEVVSVAHGFLSAAGLKEFSLRLNNIGCPECRPAYNEALRAFLERESANLCPDCLRRAATNPLRALDCKVPSCKKIMKNAPPLSDFTCESCKAHQAGLEAVLKKKNIAYTLDSGIVRGLDYYTKTVFEFVTVIDGGELTVCGGGRYDGMVESVGGKPTPAVGFGIGLERLLILLESADAHVGDKPCPALYIAPISGDFVPDAQILTDNMRNRGIPTETDFMGRSLKSQMKYADKIGARYILVLGDDEIKSGCAKLKKMETGEVTSVKLDDMSEFLKTYKI